MIQVSDQGPPADAHQLPALPSAAAEPPPNDQGVSGLVELTLFFYEDEIGQIEEDTALLIRKGALRVSTGANRATRIGEFVRFATLRHTHRAVQQMLSSDLQAADDVKKSLVDVENLRAEFKQRNENVKLKEEHLQARLDEATQTIAKYLAYLRAAGMLEDEDER